VPVLHNSSCHEDLRGMEIQLHTFLISLLGEGKYAFTVWSVCPREKYPCWRLECVGVRVGV